MKRILTMVLTVATLFTLTATGAVAASGYVGQDPYSAGCASDKRKIWPTQGEVSQGGAVIVRDKTNVLAGWVYVYHSDRCRTAWAEWATNSSFHWFHGELSLWNSWNQNQKNWTAAGQQGGRTNMVDDPPGVTTCVGMQVYYNGEWRRWQMGFCYT